MIVTISNLYGCGAVAVSRLAAARLEYELVDEQLPVVVAQRLKTSLHAVESAEDTAETVSERMLRALESGTPEVGGQTGASFDEECLREVQEAVREYAALGNVVILGRGANAILGRRPDIVRVFMHAPRDWRITHIMDVLHVDRAPAGAEVDRIDRARANYMQTYYGIKWVDPQNFDVCIDVSSFGEQGSAALIVSAVGAR